MASKAPPKRPAGRKDAGEAAETPPPPDPAVLLQLERLRQQDEELERRAALYQELLDENARLEEQRLEEDRDTYEATNFLRSELLARNQEVAALQGEVAALSAQLAAAAAEAAAHEARAAAAGEAAQAALRAECDALQAQLDSLEEFRRRRDELEAEAGGLREECGRLQAEHAEQVAALQRRLLASESSKRSAARGAEAAGSGGEEEGEEEGGDGFGGDVGRVLQHNKKLTAQMRSYAEEAAELQRGVKELEAQRTQLLREAKLQGEMEEQYARRGTLQAREIKDAASKIAGLERGMAEMAAAFEREKAALVAELRQHLAEALTEQGTLRRLLKLRTKELGHVRKLAHEVLLQRSDVEAFLLISIQQVRAEVARRAAGELGGGSASTLQLEDALAAGAKVDIRELAWEDRERVLRQLFVRINNSHRRRPLQPPPPLSPLSLPVQQSAVELLHGACTEAGPAGLA